MKFAGLHRRDRRNIASRYSCCQGLGAMGIIMQKPLVREFVLILASVACVGFAHAFTFRSSEGHFTAEFPEEPKLDEESLKGGDGTPLKLYRWVVDKGDTYYSISVTISKTRLNFNYDNGAAGFVKAINGKLISQQKLQIQGTEAREIFVDARGYIYRDRMIFVNQRIYQILYGGKPGSEKSAAAEAFLNSVHLGN